MTEIYLKELSFYAYHGLFDAEKKLGNRFEVDVKINLNDSFGNFPKKLTDTIDYGLIYKLVAIRMEIATELLENIVYDIAYQILNEFNLAQKVIVSIRKYNPPFGGLCQYVEVSESVSRL